MAFLISVDRNLFVSRSIVGTVKPAQDFQDLRNIKFQRNVDDTEELSQILSFLADEEKFSSNFGFCTDYR